MIRQPTKRGTSPVQRQERFELSAADIPAADDKQAVLQTIELHRCKSRRGRRQVVPGRCRQNLSHAIGDHGLVAVEDETENERIVRREGLIRNRVTDLR